MKSRHIKSRSVKWSHRKSRPLKRRRLGGLRQNQRRFLSSRYGGAKRQMFALMYGRGVGKTYASQHLQGVAFDFKEWASTLTLSFSSLGIAAEKMAQSFEDAAKKLEEAKLQREELMKGPSASPDIVGTLVGYRAFSFMSWDGPKLRPVGYGDYQWVPGRNEAVLCLHEETPHPCPWCGCGFWAMWEMKAIPYTSFIEYQQDAWAEVTTFGNLNRHFVPTQKAGYTGYIWGQIEAWGVVVEAERGFRAQFAKVTELYHPPAPAASDYIHSLGVAYGVPVRELSPPYT